MRFDEFIGRTVLVPVAICGVVPEVAVFWEEKALENHLGRRFLIACRIFLFPQMWKMKRKIPWKFTNDRKSDWKSETIIVPMLVVPRQDKVALPEMH